MIRRLVFPLAFYTHVSAVFGLEHGESGAIEKGQRFVFEVLRPVFLFFQQQAARKTARPAVVVVYPCAHAQPLCRIEARLYAGKPFFTEIFRF